MWKEATPAELNWASLGGRILDGGYELEELQEASEDRAKFKVRVLGDRTLESSATLYRISRPESIERIEFWQHLKALPNPALEKPLAAGYTELDGSELVFLISRRPDETLSGALAERALMPAEASEVIRSVALAMDYLNERGLVHGSVCPEQILSVGEAIQLSVEPIARATDTVMAKPTSKYVAPESTNGNRTPASDIWCLGATIVEALTQKEYRRDRLEMARDLPAPFNWTAERCLNDDPAKRPGASEIPRLLAEENKPIALAAAVGAGLEGIAGAPAEPSSNADKIPAPVTQLSAAKLPERLEEPRNPAGEAGINDRRRISATPSRSLWIYALGALAILLLVIWLARPRAEKRQETSTAVARNVSRAGVPITPSAQTQTIAPDGTALKAGTISRPSPATYRRLPAEAATVNGSAWRVIIFTYSHQEDAQKKARTINQIHPQLEASVFLPPGIQGPYLVTLGGTMSRESAVRLRQKAIGRGLPRDSYIQNYRQ